MRDWHWDKLAFTCAMLVAIGSTILAITDTTPERAAASSQPEKPAVVLSTNPNTPEASDDSGAASRPWQPPAARSRAEPWTYEMFGPPELRYDAEARRFTAETAGKARPGAEVSTRSDPQLLAVRRVPWPVQLVGYLGEGAEAVGILANLKTGETILARAGCDVPELGLTITGFTVFRRPSTTPDSTTTLETVAEAETLDLASGQKMLLNDRERCYGEALRAELRCGHDAGRSLEVAVGEDFGSDEEHFRVVQIRLNPPEVDLARLTDAGAVAGQLTLVPAPAESTAGRDAGQSP